MTIAPVAVDSIPYYTVFDVRNGYPRWTAEIVFAAVAVAIVIVLACNLRGWIRMPRPVRSGLMLMLLFLALVLLPVHVAAHRDFAAMRDAVREGRFTVVEGRVEDFQPPRRTTGYRMSRETFKVYSHHQTFRYSYMESELAPGFNAPSDRDGPIREGLRVRIADVDGRIARLEIAPNGATNSSGYIGSAPQP